MTPAEAIARIRPTLEWAENDHCAEGLLEALAILEAHLAAPAAPTLVEVESAEAFARELLSQCSTPDGWTQRGARQAGRLVAARDAASATAAKLEGGLDSLEAVIRRGEEHRVRGVPGFYALAIMEIRGELEELRSKLTGGK